MSERFRPFPMLGDEQALAADPVVHAALSASAGSGKTQVLTARVLLLLLQGVRPESILCLTFTKAAAAEMANRIGARLATWVRIPDKVLRKELFALRAEDHPRTLERARQLFARVLDCPGGLKIQTIHAFAQSLLAAFPARSRDHTRFPADRGPGRTGAGPAHARRIDRRCGRARRYQLIRDVQCLSRRSRRGRRGRLSAGLRAPT